MSQELEPLDPYFDAKKARRRRRVRKYMTRPAMSMVLKSTVLGEENVHGLRGAFILVPNHSSHLDAPMVFSLLPEWLTERLATGAAADYFYRRRGISALTSVFFNSYPIERKGKRETAEHGRAAGMTGRLLRAGVPILVFPEGTRSRTGDIGQFKSGAAALSMQVGVPLVPIAMLGGHEAMPVGSFFPKLRSEVFLFIGARCGEGKGRAPMISWGGSSTPSSSCSTSTRPTRSRRTAARPSAKPTTPPRGGLDG